MMRERMNPSVLAFDSESRLVAHDAQGLRIWPAGSISAQTPPVFKQSLPAMHRDRMAHDSDGQDIRRTKNGARSLLGHLPLECRVAGSNHPGDYPPPGWGTVPASVANKASRPVGTAGAERIPPSFPRRPDRARR